MVVLSVVLEEVKNRDLSVYNRLMALCSNTLRRFIVFSNEYHKDTYVKIETGESPDDRNDREDEEEDDVHLAPSSAGDAPRVSNLMQASAGDKEPMPTRPSGRVIGIIERNWQFYHGSLDPMSMPAADGVVADALFVSKDPMIPKIQIQTRHLGNLLDKRIVVAVDSCDRLSRYPSGHYIRTIGQIGDRDTETEISAKMGDLGSGSKSCVPSDSASIKAEFSSAAAEEAAEQVLSWVHPTLDSEEKLRDVIDHVQQLIESRLKCEVVSCGSVPLKTYLPDGDIDLTILKGPSVGESSLQDVLALLGEEHKVEFIDAKVKLVKCFEPKLDISFNQLGGLSTLCFLEQVDRHIGKDHLFKRSIILIKTWCFYESKILGARYGLLSTYALEILVMIVFNLFHSFLSGPLSALYKFLEYYSHFDWENYCISLKGPVSKSSPTVVKMPEGGRNDLLLSEKFLEDYFELFSVPSRFLGANPIAFEPKYLNIIDPLRENNNLGRSVQQEGIFRCILDAFKFGYNQLSQVLLRPRDEMADEIFNFFKNIHGMQKHDYRSSIRRLAEDLNNEESSVIDFGGLDSMSIGGKSDIFNPLADLSGDYDGNIRSFVRGLVCNGSSICDSLSSPSVNQNRKPWDIINESSAFHFEEKQKARGTGVFIPISDPLSSPSVNQNRKPWDIINESSAFHFEEKQKARGTGVFIPKPNFDFMKIGEKNKTRGSNSNSFERKRRLNAHSQPHCSVGGGNQKNSRNGSGKFDYSLKPQGSTTVLRDKGQNSQFAFIEKEFPPLCR